MFEACTLFNNVLFVAPQTQVGFYTSVEEAAGMLSKLQFPQGFSFSKSHKKKKKRKGKKKNPKPSFCS